MAGSRASRSALWSEENGYEQLYKDAKNAGAHACCSQDVLLLTASRLVPGRSMRNQTPQHQVAEAHVIHGAAHSPHTASGVMNTSLPTCLENTCFW